MGDPFRGTRRAIWERFPDPLWHLRITGPWAGRDPLKGQRDAELARIPTLDFVDQQWRMEQRVIGAAALRQIGLKQHPMPPRPAYRPLTRDELTDVAFALGWTGMAAWGAIEQHSVRAAVETSIALGHAARVWLKNQKPET